MDFKKLSKIALGILVEEICYSGHEGIINDVCNILDCCTTINNTIKEAKPKKKKKKRKKIFKNKDYNLL